MEPMRSLKDKVYAITGGGSGIGLATAELLASLGAKVSLADVNVNALQEVQTRIEKDGGKCLITAVDVANSEQVDQWIQNTVQSFGPLDGAANLAGIIPFNINIDRVEDLDNGSWGKVLDVNLTGVMYCLRAELRQMNHHGSIVNASSVAGLRGFAKNAAYVASKHAVIGLTKTVAKEVGDRGIRCNCLAPGLIDTPMQRYSTQIRGMEMPLTQQPIQRKGQAAEVAQLIAWLMSDASTFITGTVQVIDGGWFA
ncbi:hypothetical protein LTR10_015264 [Elasticomyces elasticus]|uniref:Uncharacterized protein n=1 Tax=Exophiala sideris TaxID=1016849 RepID=A0ABR0JE93_9EURO|nr:hypothetical protein LTR10_015264 [Elasticomyces elasticus]KAK5032739.1 hypothetical protein LTS07_004149 [Exophiala sideris]KAK5037081.1 hypothetical protein LTR13_004886 [Exophiala sideris]KAK5062263.1 hypothetical protein LTR69_004621 [Exophiala sideris]KAK5182239.1 hypothetical protein LTR44_005250 [Eurotiomycetes sp. CCFEE 6388]